MSDTAILRVALVLAGTGVVSSRTARFFLDGGADRLALVAGYAAYVILVVLALHPPRWAMAAGFVTVALNLLSMSRGPGLVLLVAILGLVGLWLARSRSSLVPLGVAALALWTPAVWLLSAEAARLPWIVLFAALLAVLWAAVFVVALGEAAEGVWRAGVGLLAIACVAAAADRHLTIASLAVAPDDVALAAVAVGLPLAALVPTALWRREAAILGLALAFYALSGIALVAGKPYDVDPPAIPHRAIEHLLAGEDPYRATDAQEALARFGIPLEQGTRLEDGTFLTTLNYPALSILVPAPFVAAGLTDLRYLYLAEVLGIALLAIASARERWRPFVAAAVVGDVVVARQDVLAGTDPSWALLVLVAWIFRDRRWVAPIALGLAMAARQPAWFVAPFLLLDVARERGWRESGRRALVTAVAFLVPQLPFLIATPREYLDGVLAPVLAPLVANGVGLVGFALYGPLPLPPRGALAAVALALLALLLSAVRRARDARGVLVYPFLVLYVAWRSLQNYFALLAVFALVGADDIERERTAP